MESGHSYNGFELNTTATQFVVNLTLTDQGLDQFEEVLLAVFQCIHMLQAKGVQKQYFDEMKTIEKTKFRFKEKVPSDFQWSVVLLKNKDEPYLNFIYFKEVPLELITCIFDKHLLIKHQFLDLINQYLRIHKMIIDI